MTNEQTEPVPADGRLAQRARSAVSSCADARSNLDAEVVRRGRPTQASPPAQSPQTSHPRAADPNAGATPPGRPDGPAHRRRCRRPSCDRHPAPEGSRDGAENFLLLVFSTATVMMIVAVVLVGAVDQWWVLVPVMLVDFVATFAVIVALVQLLGDDG